ncbi:MAG: hypothetical protein ABI678_21650, partial [Kofleriaceae bacterium]
MQPNPLAHPTETLRVSEKITIVTSDMELEAPDQAVDNANSLNASVARYHHYPLAWVGLHSRRI